MEFNLNEEQRICRNVVHDFVASEIKPRAQEIDEEGKFPWDLLPEMGKIGMLGTSVPVEYGGADLDAICSAIIVEELGWGEGGLALSIEAHNELGCASLVHYGSPALKEKYLPSVTSGQGKLAALALTEPQAGSDLKNMQTRARREEDSWVINGTKAWITNAMDAEFIVTLAVTDPEQASHGMSMILVPTGIPGLHIAPPEKKMGASGSHSHEVRYEQVRVPADHLLGKEGEGFQQTLRILDGGRISIGALSVGIAQAAFEEAVQYARERETFGKPLSKHQAIQWMMADAATEIHAARLMVYHAAWLKDQGRPYTKAGAMAKLFATEMAERVTRNAIQVHGAYGYSREYPVERMYRAARLMTIGEGTSEIQRMVIARRIFENPELRL